MPHPLFTIGHSNHSIATFIALLQQHHIEVLADVRSIPASRRHPQFNKAALDQSLADAGIRYVFLGRELGARREEPGAFEDNAVSYERTARLPAFQHGLAWIREQSAEQCIALMCAEKDPLTCHRTILICRHLRAAFPGRIQHILADGNLESHVDLEQRLLTATGEAANQDDLFAEDGDSPLDRAYRRRGKAMAWHRP